MAFESQVSPFTGDDDIDAFMSLVYTPFAEDVLGWVNVSPNATEYWLHRSSDTPPYVFFKAHVALAISPFTVFNALQIFTGTGVNLGEELYDQPGNPANCPNSSNYNDLYSNIQRQRHQIINSLAGPYSAYWLFGPEDGRYIHCVLKVAPRHYRHWWVGMLTPIVAGLDPNSFYVCGHYWDRFPGGPVISGLSNANEYAGAYESGHRVPHGCPSSGSTTLDGQKYQQAAQWYMPNIRGGIDWWVSDTSSGTLAVTKNVGSVNTSKTLGVAQITGYGRSMGASLYQATKSFTSGIQPLVPIQVFGSFSFDGNERIGPLARVPDVFRINMRDLEPEEEIQVGSETYVCFPVTNMDSGNWVAGDPYSAYEGLAYRKIGS